MDKFTDATLTNEKEGNNNALYTKTQLTDVQGLQNMKHALDIAILCNRVCFKNYRLEMTQLERQCHNQCFENIYSALIFSQKKFYEEMNKQQ